MNWRIWALLCCLGCRPALPAQSTAGLLAPADAVDLDPAPNVLQVSLKAERVPGAAPRYTYNGQSPGPTLRAKVGDTLIVDLENGLDDPTTIHWHGLSVPFEMDGVTWMSAPVQPGARFRYQFPLTRAGTYWYHPHFNTAAQVDGGLYGALIVEDPAEPRPTEDLVLLLDTDGELDPASTGHGLGRLHTRWMVNGVRTATHAVSGGSVLRARLINASNSGYVSLRPGAWSQIGSDQGLLPARRSSARVLLAPGDRADLELPIGRDDLDVVAEPYSLNGGPAYGAPQTLVHFAVSAPTQAPAGLPWPFVAAPVTPDPGSTDLVYAFAGSDRTGQWLINGERFPNVTIETLALGSTSVIELRNLSPTEHPFHLHGLRFEVLSVNGVAPPLQTIEDTYNVRIRERVRLLLHADAPGDWMAHCHILAHPEAGMMTVLRVR